MQEASSKQQQQNENANQTIRRQAAHLIQHCPSEEKQAKTQLKLHPMQS